MSLGSKSQKTALVTGSAGFIGFFISKHLLEENWRVVGIDCMSDYYDISLKEQRESMLLRNRYYRSVHENIEKPNLPHGKLYVLTIRPAVKTFDSEYFSLRLNLTSYIWILS